MSVTIRTAAPSDWDGFRAVFESVAEEGRWIGRELPIDWDGLRTSYAARFEHRRWLTLLADDDGAVVGWGFAEHEGSGRVSLGIGLIDGYRGAGVGTRLLEQIVGWAQERGAHKVCLELWAHNLAALALYEKVGFVVEGRHRRHWRRNDGSLWDALSMALVLDEDSPGGPVPSSARP